MICMWCACYKKRERKKGVVLSKSKVSFVLSESEYSCIRRLVSTMDLFYFMAAVNRLSLWM